MSEEKRRSYIRVELRDGRNHLVCWLVVHHRLCQADLVAGIGGPDRLAILPGIGAQVAVSSINSLIISYPPAIFE